MALHGACRRERREKLLSREGARPDLDALREEIDRAEIVEPDAIPANRVTMVGSALLGLSVGDTIEWPLPNARSRRLRVLAVTYQPEAAGDPI